MSTWEVRFSESRQLPYFYNPVNHASMWELPPGVTQKQARQMPGGELLDLAHPDQPLSAAARDPAEDLKEVRASHLLVKHEGSRRPSSWKEVRTRYLPRPTLLVPKRRHSTR